MAIWKKQNKEASACSNEKGKVLLSDDAMETVSCHGNGVRWGGEWDLDPQA